jgi:glycosyltransferase involved in cell wall biosynthesis
MKVLMLTPYLPFPPSSGGQIRSYNLIKNLSKKHQITLFSLIKSDEEKKYVSELEKYCSKVFVFKRSKTPWTLKNILRTGFGTYPFLVIRNLANDERDAIVKELKRTKYDIIHAETFYVMPHIPETKIPILLVDQTIEYLVYKHYVDEQAPFFLRPLFSIDVAKLKYWEKKYWEKATKVVAVSEADKEEMLKLSPNLDIDILPNGVALDFFKVKDNWNDREPKILFVANFKWLQNTEAVEVLLDTVFPIIEKKLPHAKLWIVGQHVPDKIKRRSGKRIMVSDLAYDDEESIKRAYYESSIFISPLRGPGGTRLKHFAAMASKLPLLTTTVGAEGLAAKNGESILVEDDFKKMADLAVSVLTNPEKAEKLANNARLLVEKKFSWSVVANKLDLLYREISKLKNGK